MFSCVAAYSNSSIIFAPQHSSSFLMFWKKVTFIIRENIYEPRVSMQAPCRHSSGGRRSSVIDSQSVLVPLGCSQLITVCCHTHNRHCRLWCVHSNMTGYSGGNVGARVCLQLFWLTIKPSGCFACAGYKNSLFFFALKSESMPRAN